MTTEQENKLKEIKVKLSLEQYDLLIQKIRTMQGYSEAPRKIDELLNKDIATIKQVISGVKNRNKKKNVKTDAKLLRISDFLEFVKKELDMEKIDILINEIEEIKKMKVEDYKKELQHAINGKEEEINELKRELESL